MNRVVMIALVVASTGCYRTRYQLAPPVGYATPSPLYTDHFHLSVFNIIELSPPVDLSAACAGVPPAAIDEQIGVLGGLVNIFTSYVVPILHIHNATVLCPAGSGPPPMMGPPPGPPA